MIDRVVGHGSYVVVKPVVVVVVGVVELVFAGRGWMRMYVCMHGCTASDWQRLQRWKCFS